MYTYVTHTHIYWAVRDTNISDLYSVKDVYAAVTLAKSCKWNQCWYTEDVFSKGQ